MWLLDTARAELHFFTSPESVSNGYAILSHVWGDKEETFQDIQALRAQCASTGANPRDLASAKIRNFCILAESSGYQWAWADTCCIDKTSSSELTEAINSMYRYYSLADVCCAYLQDVPTDHSLEFKRSSSPPSILSFSPLPLPLLTVQQPFRSSKWHRRGWTLQELVAPEVVVFVSQDWDVLGTKADLAALLEEITHIPTSVLRLETDVTDVSVAARMSWAADRKTTRLEDEAYCLMGIFGIHMPTLYGEGQQAFRRLQEEIMKVSVDTSIFAWGDCLLERRISIFQDAADDHVNEAFLLASSPAAFRGCSNRRFAPPHDALAFARRPNRESQAENIRTSGQSTSEPAGIPTFTITPYGVLAHVPVIEVFGLLVVILCCYDVEELLGLPLTRCPSAPDPVRPLYHTSFRFDAFRGLEGDTGRLIALEEGHRGFFLRRKWVAPEWRSIYLAHRSAPASPGPRRILVNRSSSTPFRLSRWLIEELERSGVILLDSNHRSLQFPWTGSPPATFRFLLNQVFIVGAIAVVRLGRCTVSVGAGSSSLGPHWATVRPSARESDAVQATHDCLVHHIEEWPHRTRTFVVGSKWEVKLTFTPYPLNMASTLVVGIEVLRAQTTDVYRSYPGIFYGRPLPLIF